MAVAKMQKLNVMLNCVCLQNAYVTEFIYTKYNICQLMVLGIKSHPITENVSKHNFHGNIVLFNFIFHKVVMKC